MESQNREQGHINVYVPVHIKDYLTLRAEQKHTTLSHLLNLIFIRFINEDKPTLTNSESIEMCERMKD